uniref:Cep57 centrosome microtubule-binding domain-containing protein n=2 Tax=Kalmanozyma brasiliensis (strain GHG001) TaxID=1365824 RepID=V5E5R3_KALBG
MKAADYQQHLASRTLTSPALRTLIGDRSKSPDSPTPAPSIDGRLHAGKTTAKPQQPRAARQSSISAISAFEDLARRLQKDVELTQRNGDARGEEVDDGSASNSGGSGFGPGSQASSARTRVDNDAAPNAGKAFQAAQFNSSGYPAHQKTVAGNDLTSPWGVRLPDVTGLTSALGSPVKARDAVKHRPFDGAVGNQEARLEELVNLRCFVDGIQVELDRAGERILNLEQAQEQQSHEFQGLRSEMQSALKDVRSQQPASDEHLMQLILEKLQGSDKQPPQTQKRNQSAPATSEPQTQREPPQPVQDTRATQQAESRSQVEVVNRLYAELDKLRMTMEQQYRNAAGYSREGAEVQVDGDARPHHAAYKHRDNFPSGRDPWDAIEALRLQVLSLADEVEGLNGLVLDHFVQPPTVSRKRSTRSNAARHRFERDERYYEDAHPASDPVYSARGASARSSTPAYRERDDIRTDPIDDHIDDYYHRRVSFHRQRSSPSRPTFGDDEYDRTIDAVSENLRVQRERQRRRHESQSAEPAELDDYEISQLADTRAALASARASPPRNTHDPQLCTVCASSLRSDKRKASRRARLLAAEQRRELVDVEESILLGQSGPVNEEQRATLRVILQEHWDEFLHQRMLYSELADELKTMEPGMSKAKRRILAQHVLEAVELLELKADRIERLQKLIGSERSERTEAEKVRKEAGSRQASKGEGNRLKHAMESFERTSRSSRAGGRNSPPTTMQL